MRRPAATVLPQFYIIKQAQKTANTRCDCRARKTAAAAGHPHQHHTCGWSVFPLHSFPHIPIVSAFTGLVKVDPPFFFVGFPGKLHFPKNIPSHGLIERFCGEVREIREQGYSAGASASRLSDSSTATTCSAPISAQPEILWLRIANLKSSKASFRSSGNAGRFSNGRTGATGDAA